jgi:hypothetical protein
MKITTRCILDMETLVWTSQEFYNYSGPVAKCCGPGGASESIANQSEAFSTTIQGDFASRFAGQNGTIANLGNILQNVQNGKLLPGFDAKTLAALNTSAIDTTASNYKNAAQATNNANASRGGDSGLQPGTVGQENATIASNAAGQLSTEQQKIQLANEQQSQQHTSTALSGYKALADIQDPYEFGKLALQTGKQAFEESDDIQQEKNQEQADIAGGIAGLASGGLTALAGGLNASPGQSFLSGAVGAFQN